MMLYLFVFFSVVQKFTAQFFVFDLVPEYVVGGYQDLVSYCDKCSFFAPPYCQAVVLAPEIGVFGTGGGPCTLHQHHPQIFVPVCDAATFFFMVVSWLSWLFHGFETIFFPVQNC